MSGCTDALVFIFDQKKKKISFTILWLMHDTTIDCSIVRSSNTDNVIIRLWLGVQKKITVPDFWMGVGRKAFLSLLSIRTTLANCGFL